MRGRSSFLPLLTALRSPGAHPFLYDRALELRQHAEHLKRVLSARRRGVDAVLVQEQVDASGTDFRKEAD